MPALFRVPLMTFIVIVLMEMFFNAVMQMPGYVYANWPVHTVAVVSGLTLFFVAVTPREFIQALAAAAAVALVVIVFMLLHAQTNPQRTDYVYRVHAILRDAFGFGGSTTTSSPAPATGPPDAPAPASNADPFFR